MIVIDRCKNTLKIHMIAIALGIIIKEDSFFAQIIATHFLAPMPLTADPPIVSTPKQ
jgi:hypothetical protein